MSEPYLTFTVNVQLQPDLELAGVGSAGIVFKVHNEDIVLKARRIYEPPSSESSIEDKKHYAEETLFHYRLMEDERAIMLQLEKQPHPNIIEVIDTSYPEGIYLCKYRTLSEIEVPTQLNRILWYQDIARGLSHIHSLGIAHADLRDENILFDESGHAFLCDFSAASIFGEAYPVYLRPDLLVPINGFSGCISDASDRFALAVLIFTLETGARPKLSTAEDGELVLPGVRTGHHGIDVIIQAA
ncbi:MAG: hypothetical protein LQ351_004904 [Letrouitia transgressa]|nr:MAG: hypothetical protein LQ351_004904 [Letrouitia transgressa]